MRLEKQPGFVTGVKCDMCGDDMFDDFTYYSLDVREVAVAGNRHAAGLAHLPVIFSLDACPRCIQRLGEAVRVHYAPTKVGVNCDLCGAQLRGDFTFYYINISAATVSMSAGQIRCAACDKHLVAPDKQCACGVTQPVRVATVTVNDKYLQVVACLRDYNNISDAVALIRQRAGLPQ